MSGRGALLFAPLQPVAGGNLAAAKSSSPCMSSIALVVIARDEARCIARCLDSVRERVDQMWVLDTGSLDATPQIARQCGAQVASFDWCDDFAAARNAALALTDCDWRLVLDADEWLESGGAALTGLRRQADAFLGQVCVASAVDAAAAGEQQSLSWLTRVLPRGVSYAGRVHEQPVSALPRRRLELRLGHDGYRPAQMARKGARNLLLLTEALREHPDDAYLHYQLGKDHEVHGRFSQAEPCFAHADRLADAHEPWRHDLLVRHLFTMKKLRRFEAALALARSKLASWAHSPDFFFALGDVLLDWAGAEPARAHELLPMVRDSWQQAVAIGENPALADTVHGRGSYLACHNLAVLHAALGQQAQARYWRELGAASRQPAHQASRLN
jgi:glycosyltransferase involved in cell wall biosynthesis